MLRKTPNTYTFYIDFDKIEVDSKDQFTKISLNK